MIFTDGSKLGPESPGPAGWAVQVNWWRDGRCESCFEFGDYDHSSSNRMELTAALQAVQEVCAAPMDLEGAQIVSDSQYVVRGVLEYSQSWSLRGGKLWKRDGSPVANDDLWCPLFAQVSACANPVHWVWVRGHQGQEGNERVDFLARDMAQMAQRWAGRG